MCILRHNLAFRNNKSVSEFKAVSFDNSNFTQLIHSTLQGKWVGLSKSFESFWLDFDWVKALKVTQSNVLLSIGGCNVRNANLNFFQILYEVKKKLGLN